MSSLILIVLAILVLDAIVSASEAAIFTVPINRVRQLAEKSKNARLLLSLKESMEGPIVTLISLSNLITIIGSVLAGLVVAEEFGKQWVGFFAALLTFLIMIAAEIIPKRLGERFAELISLVMAAPIKAAATVFAPITWLIQKITSPFTAADKPATSREEIAFLARLGQKEGTIKEYEGQLISRAFKLADITAGDMMTPKPFVFSLNGASSLGEAQELIKNASHSRIPVYENSKDNITGMVHQRDMLKALAEDKHASLIKEYMHKHLTVPESRLGDDLLKDFLESKNHLALVVSDYGNMVGIVGLEDVLEELVGEIVDEKDIAPQFIKRISRSEILVHGQTHVPHINHFFNTSINSKKSLNGFILRKLGHLPSAGESITLDNLTLIIEEVSASSIERVRMVKRE